MRPISLQINAFGPYTEKVFLDFSLLEDQKIFIINGPTGSGKTTILDAMVYALYGKTSGGARSGEEMRSDYADSTLKTLVEFIFAIGQEEYKIIRSPKQILKKKRGEGTREYPAEAAVFVKKDGEWDCVATKANDIRDWVQRIIGFREEQFLQVMLLPQGEFKKLLLASSAERASIMSELFHTEIYAKLQKKLSENLKDIQEENIRFVNKTEDILENENVVNFVELKEKLEEYKALLIVEATEFEKIKSEKNEAEKRFKNSEKLQDIKARIVILEEEKQRLEEQKTAMDEVKNFVDRMKEFSKLRGFWQELMNLKGLIDDIKVQDKLREEELTIINKEATQNEIEKENTKELVKEVEKREKELILIQNEKESVEKYESLKFNLKSLEEKLADSKKRSEICEKELEEINKNAEELDKQQKSEELLIEDNKGVELEENTQKLAIKERKKRDEKNANLLQDKKILLENEANVKNKEEISKELERTWKALDFLHQNAKAYELAKTLEDDKPCPVCGSNEHPEIAQKPEKLVSKEDLDKALAKYQEAKGEADKARFTQNESLKRIEADLIQLAELEDSEPLEDLAILEEQLSVILEKIVKLNKSKENLKNIKIKQAESKDLIKTTLEKLEKTKEKYQEAQGEYKASTKELEDLEKKLKLFTIKEIEEKEKELENLIEIDKKKVSDLETRIQKNKEERVRLQTAIEQNKTQLKISLARETELEKQIEQETKESAIDLAEFSSYEEEYFKLEASEASYQEYINAKEGLNAQLKAAKESLDELPKELESHESVSEIFKEKEEAYEEQLKKQVAIQKDKERIEQSYLNFEKLRQANEEMQKKYEMVQSLSELANGGKSGVRGFTFENYVLRAILEEVLIAANERLKQMSQGRYTLTKAPVQNGGGGYQGLDLEIFDAFTGYTRPANTLSGGETFLASLSLALGLADIVQSYAGGMHLDTIFVDEGFGTLDPETLEMALKAIIKLQEHGRLVGIISHVPELKERIPARLTVKKSDRGSTAYFEV